MSIRQFEQERARGLPSPIYLLYGPDDYLLYDALMNVCDTPGVTDAFNLDVIDFASPDQTTTVDAIIDLMNTLPMMSLRRTVILKGIHKIPKREFKKLESYLGQPSETTLLVMLSETPPSKVLTPDVQKQVKAIALVVQERDLPAWILQKGQRHGVTISNDTVDFLIHAVGTDLGMLHSEIEKLAALGKKEICLKEARDVIYAGVEFTAFDLVNAILKKDPPKVFRIYNHLSRSMDATIVLGALNWQFKRQWIRSPKRGDVQEDRRFSSIVKLLHSADIGLKTSQNCAIEELLVRLLRLA